VQQRRDEPALDWDIGVSECVYAPVNRVQPPLPTPPVDRTLADSTVPQLLKADHTPLRRSDGRRSKCRGLGPRGGSRRRRFRGHSSRVTIIL
jgi:hypothetical protein